MSTTRNHRLEVGEDIAFQERAWRFLRIGRVVLVAFLLAGALGILGGGGPLVSGRATAGALGVEFERFVRRNTATEITLAAQIGGGEPVVELDREFLGSVRIERFIPPPLASVATREGMAYRFAAADGNWTAILTLQPRRIGPGEGRIRCAGAETAIRWFVHP